MGGGGGAVDLALDFRIFGMVSITFLFAPTRVKVIHVYVCVNTSVSMMFHVCNKFTHSVQT